MKMGNQIRADGFGARKSDPEVCLRDEGLSLIFVKLSPKAMQELVTAWKVRHGWGWK